MAFCLELRHLFKRLSCSDVLLGMGVLLVELYLSLRFASHHTPAQVFVFVTFCAIALADSCFVKHLVKSERLDRKTLAIFIGLSVVVGVLLEGLTVLGSPASYFANLHDWNKRRLVVFAFAAFFVIQAGFLKKDAVNAAWLALKRDSSKRCKAMMIAVTVVAICLVVTFRAGAAQPLFFDAIAGLMFFSIDLAVSFGKPSYGFISSVLSLLVSIVLSKILFSFGVFQDDANIISMVIVAAYGVGLFVAGCLIAHLIKVRRNLCQKD